MTVAGRNIVDMDAYEVRLLFDADKLELVKSQSDIRDGYSAGAKADGGNKTFAFAKKGNAETENGNMSLCTFTFRGNA